MSVTSEAIDRANNILVGMLTAFNNKIGPDNGDDLGELYAAYCLSTPPTLAQFNGMGVRLRIGYRDAEGVFEARAVAMEDVHDLLIAIKTDSNPFGLNHRHPREHYNQ